MSHDLESMAATLVAEGKGILAADETVPTLTRRFEALGIQSTVEVAEFRAVLAGLPDAVKPLAEVAYITGWRIRSELLTRQWIHGDFENTPRPPHLFNGRRGH